METSAKSPETPVVPSDGNQHQAHPQADSQAESVDVGSAPACDELASQSPDPVPLTIGVATVPIATGACYALMATDPGTSLAGPLLGVMVVVLGAITASAVGIKLASQARPVVARRTSKVLCIAALIVSVGFVVVMLLGSIAIG